MASKQGHHPEEGLFAQRRSDTYFSGRQCLFLDRDGVLVEETNYLHRIEDVVLIDGVFEAIARANAMGIAVVMVTNQAGIGRGYYDWQQFRSVQEYILRRGEQLGATYDMVFACAYHAEGVPPFTRGGHSWRKPGPGMLLEAARVLGVDLARSHIVGDTLNDLIAGKQAGLPGGTLVRTGHGEREWRTSGEKFFADCRKSGSFRPACAANAVQAIDDWLATVSSEGSAS